MEIWQPGWLSGWELARRSPHDFASRGLPFHSLGLLQARRIPHGKKLLGFLLSKPPAVGCSVSFCLQHEYLTHWSQNWLQIHFFMQNFKQLHRNIAKIAVFRARRLTYVNIFRPKTLLPIFWKLLLPASTQIQDFRTEAP